MSQYYGFRSVTVLENVTSGEFGSNCPLAIEVTAATDTKILINDNPSGGFRAQGIPIKAGATRIIPMQVIRFSTNNPVTVVAYRP